MALLLIASAPAGSADTQPELSAYIAEALRNNPEFAVLQRKVEMLEHRLPQAEALPDPMVGLQFMGMPVDTNPFDLSMEPMTQVQAMYAQMFPAPGVRSLRRQVAALDIDLVGLERLGREVAIATLVRSAWLQLAYDLRAVAIAGDSLDLLNSFAEIARSRYQVGQGLLSDVLQAQVEVSRIQAELIGLRRAVATSRARLNTILGRPMDDPLPDPPPLALRAADTSLPDLRAAAESANPELLELAKMGEKSRLSADLARAMFKPDYTLQFAYSYRYDRGDMWNAGISFNLPLWRGEKQREMAAEMEAGERMANAMMTARRNDIAFMLRTALDKRAAASERYRLYTETIIPQARQSLQASRAAWEVDKVQFTTVIMDQMKLFELELMAEMQILEHEMSLVDIDAVTGTIPGRTATR